MEKAERIFEILRDAKKLAQEYRALTGKPLGIAGEVAEYEAARILNLELTPARHAGHDAVDAKGRRLQIKGRCVLPGSKRGQKLGSIDAEKDFDSVLFVEMDERFDAVEIYESDRSAVVEGPDGSALFKGPPRARPAQCLEIQENRSPRLAQGDRCRLTRIKHRCLHGSLA